MDRNLAGYILFLIKKTTTILIHNQSEPFTCKKEEMPERGIKKCSNKPFSSDSI